MKQLGRLVVAQGLGKTLFQLAEVCTVIAGTYQTKGDRSGEQLWDHFGTKLYDLSEEAVRRLGK